MSRKPKIVEPEKKTATPELVEVLQGIICNLQRYVDYCNQKMSAVYVVKNFVQDFAYQKARLDKMRQDVADVIENGTEAELDAAIRKLHYNEDNKAFDFVWSDIASLYDSLIVDYCEDATSSPYERFQTSDEIYKDCWKYVISPKNGTSIDQKREYARALMNL